MRAMLMSDPLLSVPRCWAVDLSGIHAGFVAWTLWGRIRKSHPRDVRAWVVL
jgi:hypothetical protein